MAHGKLVRQLIRLGEECDFLYACGDRGTRTYVSEGTSVSVARGRQLSDSVVFNTRLDKAKAFGKRAISHIPKAFL